MNLRSEFALGACTIGLLTIAGCQTGPSAKPSDSAAVRDDVTDIRPMDSSTPAPAPQPVVYAQPVAPAPAPAPAASNTHVVQRGETFYSIAKETYGDGKQWQKIAMANPGVTPTSLKIGQTLVIP